MIKNLFLIRHGEAEHLLGERLTGGWTDSSLTEKGRQQAHNTGKRILDLVREFEVVLYCSDLSRAKESAEVIGSYLNKKPMPVKELREQNNGQAANLSTEEARRIALPRSEPIMDWIHYPGAESWRSFNKRVFEFMDVLEKKSPENVVVVSHRRTILAIIHWWLELSEVYIKRISFDIDPCSVTYLRVNKWGEKTISKLNDNIHVILNGQS